MSGGRPSGLGRRIAAAVLLPAAAAIIAIDVFAVKAARDAEREAVLGRMERAAGIVSLEKRFFLDAPLDTEEVRRRLALIAGFEWVLRREGGRTASSLDDDTATRALDAATAAIDARAAVVELDEGVDPASLVGPGAVDVDLQGTRYLVRGADLDGSLLLLLFPADAVDEAGRRTALPVLLASAFALAAAGIAALLLGGSLAAPLRVLARGAGRAAREGSDLPPVGAGAAAEVHDLTDSLQHMLEELRAVGVEDVRRERLAVLGEFAAGVAHEIRNPLSSMRMTLQLLEADGARGDDVGVVLSEIDRLERSVDELLVFAGEPRLETACVDLHDLALEAASVLRPQSGHLGVKVVVEGPVGVTVTGDRRRLRTCVDNLLLNALQVTPRGGTVRILLRAEGGRAWLAVEDEGPGIPAEAAPHIWEPFYSGRPGGTGLGLAVTRRLVQLHEGEVSFRSGAAGTRFELDLPASLGDSGPNG